MAKAMETQDSKLFLEQIDMQRFALAQVQGITKENAPLNTLDNLGKMLGIGGISDLVGSVVDVETATTEYFNRGVSTGELILECTASQKPYCPWVPEALKKAIVKELSSKAAVAKVTTPAGMTSWIVLAKKNAAWKVAGQAVLENEATALALQELPEQTSNSGKKTQSKNTDPYAPAPPPPASDGKAHSPLVEL